MNPYGLFADGILIAHFIFFLFCVAGEAAVLAGAAVSRLARTNKARKSRVWFRNRTFRLIHLFSVVFVGIEGLAGFLCPLTVWEYELRRAAGQAVEAEIPLVARVVRSLLFHDFPPLVFTALYVGFAVLVALTFLLVRPERGKRD